MAAKNNIRQQLISKYSNPNGLDRAGPNRKSRVTNLMRPIGGYSLVHIVTKISLGKSTPPVFSATPRISDSALRKVLKSSALA